MLDTRLVYCNILKSELKSLILAVVQNWQSQPAILSDNSKHLYYVTCKLPIIIYDQLFYSFFVHC